MKNLLHSLPNGAGIGYERFDDYLKTVTIEELAASKA